MSKTAGSAAVYTARDVHGRTAAELEAMALRWAAEYFDAGPEHLEIAESYATSQRGAVSYATVLVRLAQD